MTPEEAASKLTPQMRLALTTWCQEGVVHSDTEDATKRGLVTRGLGVWVCGQKVVLNELGLEVRKVVVREAMLARRDKVHAQHPEIKTASDFAPLMGDLAVEYVLWHLERLKTELDASGLPLKEAFDERDRQRAAQQSSSTASPKEETSE